MNAPSFGLRLGCGHLAAWRDGRLAAPGHHGEGEGALASLGGGVPACSAMLGAWAAILATARHAPVELASSLLVLAPGPHELAAAHAAAVRGAVDDADPTLDRAIQVLAGCSDDPKDLAVAQLVRVGGLRSGERHRLSSLRTRRAHALAQVVGALPALWRAAAIAELVEARASWILGPRDGEAEPERTELLVMAAEVASAATGRTVAIDPWSVGELRADGSLVLPWTWLSRVWFPGAALVDGRPCVSLRALGDEAVARVVEGDAVIARLTGPGGGLRISTGAAAQGR